MSSHRLQLPHEGERKGCAIAFLKVTYSASLDITVERAMADTVGKSRCDMHCAAL
jgi:hypothetical protein